MSFFYNFSYIFSFAFYLFLVRDATMFLLDVNAISHLSICSFNPLLTFHLPLCLCAPVSILVSYWYFVLFCFQTFCLLHSLFTIHYSLFIIHLVLFTSTIDIYRYIYLFYCFVCSIVRPFVCFMCFLHLLMCYNIMLCLPRNAQCRIYILS